MYLLCRFLEELYTNLVEKLQVCCESKLVFYLFSHMAKAVAQDWHWYTKLEDYDLVSILKDIIEICKGFDGCVSSEN